MVGLDGEIPPWFREAFDRHYGEVVHHACHLIQDAAGAEDIAQETFVRLYLACTGGVSPPDRPRSWLLAVATRLAYNHLRAEERRRRREAAYVGTAADGPKEGTDHGSGLDLLRALERLEPRDRLALLLRAAGYAYADVASALGIEVSSVGTLLARARRRLAAVFEDSAVAMTGGKGDDNR
ncbi:MAG: sigma-70 family RNA polymerase sigma factor [Clostridia bacterium]|nr:sigma-70 family RNA polymerase sigma factor [Clostridia bacterium]